MADLQDQIRAWTDAASAGPPPVTVDEARERAGRGGRAGRRRPGPRRAPWLAAAALLLMGVAVAGLVVVLADDAGEELATGEGVEDGSEVVFSVLGRSDRTDESLGTLRSAVDADGLDALWVGARLEGRPPAVDFDARAVVSITIPDDLCPPTLTGFDRAGRTLVPSFTEPPGDCEQPLVGRTFVVSLAWSDTSPSFRLALPADQGDDVGPRVLDVGRPLPSDAATPVIWPTRTTSADRSSPEAAARSFVAHVLGDVDVGTTVGSPERPGRPTPVEVDLGTTTTTVLTVSTTDGWAVLRVGDGSVGVSTDPPRVRLPDRPGAERVEVLVDTDHGATATVHEVADTADGVELPPGDVQSIVTVHRADSGAVVALDGARP